MAYILMICALTESLAKDIISADGFGKPMRSLLAPCFGTSLPGITMAYAMVVPEWRSG